MLCFPNAKINIGLNVVEKRSDGYHNLETVFYPIPISDALEIIVNPELQSDYCLHNSGIEVDSEDKDNICVKALMLIKENYTIPPIDIFLHKNIPFGAGLGGGSADGAFMLKLLNDTFELNLSISQLKAMALQLGADCPFFIDNQPAYATGIGDQLTNTDVDLSGLFIYLIKPPIHISTPEAYSGVIASPSSQSLMKDIALPIKNWKDTIKNDFENNIFLNHPKIAQIKKDLYANGAMYSAMSGSGSTVYGIFNKEVKLKFDPSYFVWSGKL